MFEFRSLQIDGGRGTIPRSRRETKRVLRSLGKSLGLEVRFVHRVKDSKSYCSVQRRRIVICEGTDKYGPANRVWLVHQALHEMAHWIQYNEGVFSKYYGRPYYNQWLHPSPPDVRRLALRAERHCDWLARRMSLEFFGFYLQKGSTVYDLADASKFLQKFYGRRGSAPR